MKQTPLISWILISVGVILLFLLNLRLGSEWIPWKVFWESFTDENIYSRILWDFRWPKALTALCVGGALGVSGLLMQTLFGNPMAGPFVLGISSGASLSVALLVLGSGIGSGLLLSNFTVAAAAFIGAIGVCFIILGISYRLRSIMSVLIFGLMLGSFTGAIVANLSFFSNAENLQKYIFWGLGNLGGLTPTTLKILTISVGIGLGLGFTAIKGLNALILGEQYARSTGVNLKNIRLLSIASCGILTGISTAFVGPIGFVGLAVPHICRMALDTNNHQTLYPACFLVGGGLLLACDTLAQLPGLSYVLPINGVTSLLGAPLVIWLILKQRKTWAND